jgi:hypothetical protein
MTKAQKFYKTGTCSVSAKEEIWIAMLKLFGDVEPEPEPDVVQFALSLLQDVGLCVGPALTICS